MKSRPTPTPAEPRTRAAAALWRRRVGSMVVGVVLLAAVGTGATWAIRQHAADRTTAHAPDAAGTVAEERLYRSTSGEAFLDVRLTLDRKKLTVAERLHLRAAIRARTSAVLTLPTIADRLGDFTVAASERSSHPLADGTIEEQWNLVLEPFLAGDKSIPELEIRAADGPTKLAVHTDPITLTVVAVVPGASDSTPLEPAQPPVMLEASRASPAWKLPAAVAGTIAFVLGVGALAWRRSRRRLVDPVADARRRVARVQTEAVGASLADSSHLAAELHAAFAAWLAVRWQVPARTHTPGEVNAALLNHATLPADLKQEITLILVEMERARFAPDAATGPTVERLAVRCLHAMQRATAAGAKEAA